MACLRKSGSILAKAVTTDAQHLPVPLLQFVRGIKPRWLPKSKSKIFYVRTPTPVDPVEAVELRTMYFHYRTELRSIRKFMLDQNEQKLALVRSQSATEDRDNLAEFVAMEEQNNQWNSRVQAAREEGYQKVKERHDERYQQWQERQQRRTQKRSRKAQTKLDQNLEASESFITLDNLDTQIEQLLNLRKDYNFAIDKQGNKIDIESGQETGKTTGDSHQQESVKS